MTKGSSNYEWELLKIIHHPTKCSGHRHLGVGDVMVLVYHVILQDHMIKESCAFIGSSPTK